MRAAGRREDPWAGRLSRALHLRPDADLSDPRQGPSLRICINPRDHIRLFCTLSAGASTSTSRIVVHAVMTAQPLSYRYQADFPAPFAADRFISSCSESHFASIFAASLSSPSTILLYMVSESVAGTTKVCAGISAGMTGLRSCGVSSLATFRFCGELCIVLYITCDSVGSDRRSVVCAPVANKGCDLYMLRVCLYGLRVAYCLERSYAKLERWRSTTLCFMVAVGALGLADNLMLSSISRRISLLRFIVDIVCLI